MKSLGMTPEDFGLKVRADPNGLIVTARNKMQSGRTIERVISASNQYLETTRLFRRASIVNDNAAAVRSLVADLAKRGITWERSTVGDAGVLWRSVPKSAVSGLLRSFLVHPQNFTFQPLDLAGFIDSFGGPILDTWDVAMPGGESVHPLELAGDKDCRMQKRSVTEGSAGDLLVSGRSARVASRGAEREGLSKAQILDAEAKFFAANPGKINVPDHAYRSERSRPLLLVHVIDATLKGPGSQEEQLPCEPSPLIALGLSFPHLGDEAGSRRLLYRINLVEWRTFFETEQDDDVEVDDVP